VNREGFEIDDAILTVFERFEVVWPLDISDHGTVFANLTDRAVNAPTSSPIETSRERSH
jgi:hypothetical protein